MFGSESLSGSLTAHRRGRRAVLFAIACAPALLSLAGCGEKKIPVYSAAGNVSFAGQPPVGAQLVLHSTTDSLPPNIVPTATIKPDGSYQFSVYAEGDGAPAGDFVGTIQWFKVVQNEGGSGRGPNVLPAKYADPLTSPIKVTIKPEPGNQLDPIAIAKQ